MKCPRSIRELLSVSGFIAEAQIKGLFGDPAARLIRLRRRKKRPCARSVGNAAAAGTTNGCVGFEISAWRAGASTSSSSVGA